MNCIGCAMIRTACLFGCMMYGGAAFCQFNDSTHYLMSYAATGTINRATEGKSYVLNNAFSFEVNKKNMSLNSSNSWVYGETNDQLSINDFTSSLNFDVNRAVRTWYYWGLASYTTSYSLQINNQFQVGGGIGHNTIRKPNAELVISDGLLFESSNLYGTPEAAGTHVTVRNSLRIKYRWVIANVVVIDGMHFWQPSLTSLSNYIVRSANNLSITLNKWLSLTTSVAYNRYNQTNRENLLINFGVTFQKYF
jgi:hypothetical protein